MNLIKKISKLSDYYNKPKGESVQFYLDLESQMAKEQKIIGCYIPDRIKQDAYKVVETYLKKGEGWNMPYVNNNHRGENGKT